MTILSETKACKWCQETNTNMIKCGLGVIAHNLHHYRTKLSLKAKKKKYPNMLIIVSDSKGNKGQYYHKSNHVSGAKKPAPM